MNGHMPNHECGQDFPQMVPCTVHIVKSKKNTSPARHTFRHLGQLFFPARKMHENVVGTQADRIRDSGLPVSQYIKNSSIQLVRSVFSHFPNQCNVVLRLFFVCDFMKCVGR